MRRFEREARPRPPCDRRRVRVYPPRAKRAWAYAHRGAAYTDLGEWKHAIVDLNVRRGPASSPRVHVKRGTSDLAAADRGGAAQLVPDPIVAGPDPRSLWAPMVTVNARCRSPRQSGRALRYFGNPPLIRPSYASFHGDSGGSDNRAVRGSGTAQRVPSAHRVVAIETPKLSPSRHAAGHLPALPRKPQWRREPRGRPGKIARDRS